MIGHKHVGITNLLVNLDRFDEVDISFVGEDLNKIVSVATDVAEVHIEDFLASAEISNHIKNFHPWVVEIFGDGSLAEVKPMVNAFLNGDEFLEPVDSAQHPGYALIPFRRHARILRMAGHSNFVLSGHRNHTVEKIRNALPEGVGVHSPSPGERRFRMSFGEIPYVVHSIATPRCATGAKNTKDAHVVFDGWNASHRAVLNKRLQLLDVTVALRTLSQHDRRMLFLVDEAGRQEWRRDAVDADAVFCSHVDHALELINGCVKTVALDLRIPTDVLHSITGKVPEVNIVSWRRLASQLHHPRR